MTENRKVSFAALAIIIATSMIISTSMCLTPSDAGPNDIIYVSTADDLARIGTGIIVDGTEWSLDAVYVQQNDISLAGRTTESLTVTFATGPDWGYQNDQSYDCRIYITVTSEYQLSDINCELYLDEDTSYYVTADSIPVINRDQLQYGSFLRLYIHDDTDSVFDVTLNIPFIPDYEGDDVTGEYRDLRDFSMTETYSCNLFPIGGDGRPFTGTYRGMGYTIDGLNQEIVFGSSLSGLPNYLFNEDFNIHDIYAGLFAYVYNGEVSDLGLTGGTIDLRDNGTETAYYANLNVGGLAGFITSNTWIDGCYNMNALSAASTHELRGSVRMGGIVGFADSGGDFKSGIRSCFNTGALNSGIGMSYIGGIIGYNFYTGITECYNSGSITCIAPFTHKTSALGGLTGFVLESDITDCYNRGNITGYVFGFPDIWPCNSYIGGIAGESMGLSSFSNCYSTGTISFVETPFPDVEDQNSRPYLSGGIVGHLCDYAFITNCYYLEDPENIGLETLELFGSKDLSYDYVIDGIYFENGVPQPQPDSRSEKLSGIRTKDELKEKCPNSDNFPYYTEETKINGDYTVPGWNFGTVQTESPWSIDRKGFNDGYPVLTTFLGKIDVEVSPETGGKVRNTVFYGTFDGNIEAVPNEGFVFSEWENEETDSVRSLKISHWKQQQYTPLTAEFVQPYTITAAADENSRIFPAEKNFVAPGGSITFEFGASEGYEITVYVDDEPLDRAQTERGWYTFDDVSGDHDISVTSQIKKYFITAVADNNSTISPSSTEVDHGGSITFRFSALQGYRISAVYVDGNPLGQSQIELGKYTFSNIDKEHSISVRSERASVTVSAEADEGSTISPGTTRVPYGGSVTFVFGAKDGYTLKDIIIDGASRSDLIDAGTYTFANVNGNHSISVISEEVASTVILTVDSSGSGTITYSINGGEILQYTSPIEVTVGSSVTLYAEGIDDFKFSNWIVKGETIESSTVTISDLEASTFVSVVFIIPEADNGGLSPEIAAVMLIITIAANAAIIICLILSILERFGYLILGEGLTRFFKIKRTLKIVAVIIGAVAAVTLVGARRIEKGGKYEFELKKNNNIRGDLNPDDYLVEYQLEGSDEWVQITDVSGKFTVPDVNHPLEIRVTYRGA